MQKRTSNQQVDFGDMLRFNSVILYQLKTTTSVSKITKNTTRNSAVLLKCHIRLQIKS